MNRRFLNLSLVVAFLIILGSCKKSMEEPTLLTQTQNETLVTNEGGRLKFKSSEALNKVLNLLGNKSESYLANWEGELNFTSLRSNHDKDSTLLEFGFPLPFLSIINPSGEYMIGDTILWYHEGYRHLIINKDEELLSNVKQNPSLSKLKFKAGIAPISFEGNPKNKNTTSEVWLGYGAIDARYQYHFYNDWGHLRKLIFEVQNYTQEYPGLGYRNWIYTRIKQEWKGSRSWKPAGEETYKSITNLSYEIKYFNINGWQTSSGAVASIGPQIDGNNLEYQIGHYITSGQTGGGLSVTVSGNYYARVTAPYNSNGLYSLYATW